MHTGKDGMYSQRRVLGTMSFVGIMYIAPYGVYYNVPIQDTLTILAGLTVALLGLTTWQNTKDANN